MIQISCIVSIFHPDFCIDMSKRDQMAASSKASLTSEISMGDFFFSHRPRVQPSSLKSENSIFPAHLKVIKYPDSIKVRRLRSPDLHTRISINSPGVGDIYGNIIYIANSAILFLCLAFSIAPSCLQDKIQIANKVTPGMTSFRLITSQVPLAAIDINVLISSKHSGPVSCSLSKCTLWPLNTVPTPVEILYWYC